MQVPRWAVQEAACVARRAWAKLPFGPFGASLPAGRVRMDSGLRGGMGSSADAPDALQIEMRSGLSSEFDDELEVRCPRGGA